MRATVFDLPFHIRPEIPGCLARRHGLPLPLDAPDATLTTKAFASDDSGRLLDRPAHIIVLPLLAPFVAQVPRMQCSNDVRLSSPMRKRVNRIGQIHPRSIAAVPGISAELVDALQRDLRSQSAASAQLRISGLVPRGPSSSWVRTAVRNSVPCSYSVPLLSMRRTNGYRPSLPLYLSLRFV